MFQLFVGEIGFPRREFLHDLRWWEVQSIIRGYNRRHRDLWSATRWQTYNLMCVSMADIKKVGIYNPTDLIKFPWEKETTSLPTQTEIDELQAEMASINAQLQESGGT